MAAHSGRRALTLAWTWRRIRPAAPCQSTHQRPRAPCPAAGGRTTPSAAPDATRPSGSWHQPARPPPGPARTRPARQSRTPAHPARPGNARHAGPARPPGSTRVLAFTDPARSVLATIDLQKTRNHFRTQNQRDRKKNPLVQGLDGLKGPQGTLGIFISRKAALLLDRSVRVSGSGHRSR